MVANKRTRETVRLAKAAGDQNQAAVDVALDQVRFHVKTLKPVVDRMRRVIKHHELMTEQLERLDSAETTEERAVIYQEMIGSDSRLRHLLMLFRNALHAYNTADDKRLIKHGMAEVSSVGEKLGKLTGRRKSPKQ